MEGGSKLRRLARHCGIQTSYRDNSGQEKIISDQTLSTLIGALGQESSEEEWGLEPVYVCWNGRARRLKVDVGGTGKVLAKIELENSGELPVKSAQLGGESYELRLPNLPEGYHTLSVERGEEHREALLLSAPDEVYAVPEETLEWGFFCPIYALRSERGWGAGSFGEWMKFAEWAGANGAGVVSTLPVLATFLDEKVFEPSPYSPASRLFWNEFFVDLPLAPEFRCRRVERLVRSTNFKTSIESFRSRGLVAYREEMGLKRAVMNAMADELLRTDGERRKDFERFIRSRDYLKDYARFRVALEKNGKLGAKLPAFSESGREIHRQMYAQWLAQEQMDQVLSACRGAGVKFYLDLPLGVNTKSFDAWRFKNFFVQNMSTGAPPDSFFTKGQDWGFAPLHPHRMRELRYRYVIDYLRFQMKHTGMLRIDHVMGLHRLWWVPKGFPPGAGAYVGYPAEELYAILAIESHRHKTVLVGENLGTVPDVVNKSMERRRVRKLYVLQYEQGATGAVRAPRRNEVASLNTHDMPTFAAFVKGLDIGDRQSLGLMTRAQAMGERKQRSRQRLALEKFLRGKRLLSRRKTSVKELTKAALLYLAGSEAQTVLVSLEDTWLETKPQNVPGTSSERPNWQRKTRKSLEQIMQDKELFRLCSELTKKRSSG